MGIKKRKNYMPELDYKKEREEKLILSENRIRKMAHKLGIGFQLLPSNEMKGVIETLQEANDNIKNVLEPIVRHSFPQSECPTIPIKEIKEEKEIKRANVIEIE